MNRKLITSALPYVNNVPHLGNLIQMLSADVFARFCRSRGYDTVYVCGTDEYGTATETKAMEENKTPRELCDYYHAIHKDIYKWFNISFDYFGRTSTSQQTEIVQSIFSDLNKNGYISEHSSEQLYCSHCNRYLADRYVRGVCPKCGYEDARGDQCEKCGTLLDPKDLKTARCSTCNNTPEIRETKHLYINLPEIQKKYQPWMEETSKKGEWSENAVQMTKAWIRDGLQERAITRDLKWGIPVPMDGYENKVFYVWFDAPIGYISITKALADSLAEKGVKTFDWKSWWLPEESESTEKLPPVELFQFIGKDNIPFHTVIFPSSLIGTGKNWTKLHHISSTEYLNYEDGKFSKSKGVGVFGTDSKETGIPADAWRFYIFYNRPEKSDFQFTWKDFQEKLNSELIGNLGNLVNRTLLFVNRYYDGKIPQADEDKEFWEKVRVLEEKACKHLESAELKDAFRTMFEISDICNKKFQAAEPWKTRETEPKKAESLLYNLCYAIKDLMIMMHPYMPQYTKKVMSFFGKTIADSIISLPSNGLDWNDIGKLEGLSEVFPAEIFFTPMDTKTMEEFRKKFAGNQSERIAENKKSKKTQNIQNQCEYFTKNIKLTVGKILSVERNPSADKLYIEHIDDGSGKDRIIQSGLVPYLKPEDLLGKHVIIADNLKPKTIKGVESRGMILAADYKKEDGTESVEVLQAPWAAPGTTLILEGESSVSQKPEEIDFDVFSKVAINIVDNFVEISGKKLLADKKSIQTSLAKNGGVH